MATYHSFENLARRATAFNAIVQRFGHLPAGRKTLNAQGGQHISHGFAA